MVAHVGVPASEKRKRLPPDDNFRDPGLAYSLARAVARQPGRATVALPGTHQLHTQRRVDIEDIAFGLGLLVGGISATVGSVRLRSVIWRVVLPASMAIAAFAAATIWGRPYSGLLVLFVSVATGSGYLIGMLATFFTRRAIHRRTG